MRNKKDTTRRHSCDHDNKQTNKQTKKKKKKNTQKKKKKKITTKNNKLQQRSRFGAVSRENYRWAGMLELVFHDRNLDIHSKHLKNTNTVEPQWLEHRWFVYHGLFELVFESLRNSSDNSRKQIFREIFLFKYEIVFCVHLLESPHRGDSNDCTQHTIIVYKIENIFINYRHLLPDLAP